MTHQPRPAGDALGSSKSHLYYYKTKAELPTAAGCDTDSAPLLVDTSALQIEEPRGSDQLLDKKKQEGCDEFAGYRTLQPTTGDQGIVRGIFHPHHCPQTHLLLQHTVAVS
jgi:hypothetical protein